MPSSPEGRRDRKKSATRAALREAALRLALTVGYDHLTVEAITQDVDVSTRTFFNYFSSKDDALLGLDPERAAEFRVLIAGRPADESPVAALRAALIGLAASFTERQALWQARMELLQANPHLWPAMHAAFGALERTLTEAVAARTGHHPDLDLYPGVVAAAAMGAVRVAVAHWRAGGQAPAGAEPSAGAQPSSGVGARPLTELLTEAFDLLTAGLAPPPPTRSLPPTGPLPTTGVLR